MTLTPIPMPTGSSPVTLSDLERRLIDRTNYYRAQNHCAPLAPSPPLAAAARAHSAEMAQNNYFDHPGLDGSTPITRAQRAGYPSAYVGENLAAGYAQPEQVVDEWMSEQPPNDGHRQNVINCLYTEIGVGYAEKTGTNFRYYWTQDLGNPNP